MKRFASVLLALIVILSSGSITALADNQINYVSIAFTAEELESNPASVIETALAEARDNANYYNRYVITVPSGTYEMTKALHIYSYTSLISQPDTYYNRAFQSGNMLKCGKEGEEFFGYDGYTDMYIEGGVWDNMFLGTSCGMRFGHCRNLIVKNLTVKNVKNNHHIEFAAASDVSISNCVFSGYSRSVNSSQEAVQIDVIHSDEHFPSYAQFDDTPCRNISVTGCYFENVFSGVGTRSGVIGSYFDNINISYNIFSNVTNKAITCFNYINSTITGNFIDNVSVGVFFEYYPTKNLITTMYKANNPSFIPYIINDSNTTISNNTINVKNKASYATSCGIGLYGGKLSAANANKYKLVAGNYVINKVNIKNNTITVLSAKSHGIDLKYVNPSVFKDNLVTYGVKRNSNYYSLNLSNSSINMKGDDATFSFMTGKKVYKLTNKSVAPKVKSKKHYAEITWKKISNATGYKIYRSTKKSGEYELIKTVKGAKNLKYTDKKVKKNKTYYYKVVAYKSADSSTIFGKFSAVKKVKIK